MRTGFSVFRFLCPDNYKPTKSKIVKPEKEKKTTRTRVNKTIDITQWLLDSMEPKKD